MHIVKGEAVGSGVPRDKRGIPATAESTVQTVASPKAKQAEQVGAEPTEREADYQAAQSRVDFGSPAEPGDDTKIASRFDEPPKDYAAKTEWVDYAVSRGADRDKAEEATKTELIGRYGKEN